MNRFAAAWVAAGAVSACTVTGIIGEERDAISGGGAGSGGSSGTASGSGGTSGGAGGSAQGGAGPGGAGPCEETTGILDRSALDVVMAVDTTSPNEAIDNVENGINTFTGALEAAGVDWQISIIATRGNSSGQLCVPPPLALDNCIEQPPYHHLDCFTFPRTLLSVIANSYVAANPFSCIGLTFPQPWSQNVRFDALKVFIAVSDEDAGPMPASFDGRTFDGFLINADPAGMFGSVLARNYVFHSIVGTEMGEPPEPCDDGAINASNVGFEYAALSDASGGLVESICQADYRPAFQRFADASLDRLRCERVLTDAPPGFAPDEVTVTYTSGDGSVEMVPQDNTAICGLGADGWQWNGDQTRINLCGPTCDRIDADPAGMLGITYGCPPDEGG